MVDQQPDARPWTPTSEVVDAMCASIVRQFAPLRVILFGSLARGEGGPDSDVDLLVVMPNGTDRRRKAGEIRRLLAAAPVSKDILVTTPDEIARRGMTIGSVLRPALREGRVLYERR